MKEKLYAFMLDGEESSAKLNFITTVSKTLANMICRTDYVSNLYNVYAVMILIDKNSWY